ncbi:C45 family autoproteolytic acyltransferase/hydolase [Longirhabdus pacifica]|uniref:C45 family autoproteolytic acyltransferase/hydolase n=1 Tax=Longirhabdus pacifica TaxID=2305227 RepID=UPI001008C44E|nr:C45 family peptidase [Longirhabdus pacifica]
MYHPRLKGNAYEAGKHYGSILWKNGFVLPEVSEEKLRYGTSCIPILEDFDPHVVKEIKGFADGCQASYEEVCSFLLSLGVLQPSGQCSIFAAFNGDDMIVGRNYDMLFDLKKFTESSLVCYEDKHKYIGHSDCFIGKVDGVNEHGLFVGISSVPHVGVKPGLNFYFAVKYILENCSTVQEGIEVLQQFPSSVSNNYLLADKSGQMAVMEVSPDGYQVRKPKGHYIHCTNHHVNMISPEGWNWSKSEERYATLDSRLKEEAGHMDVDIAQSIMSGTKGHVCLNLKQQKFGTLYSVVTNLNALQLFRAEGQPNKAKYILDERLNKSIAKSM